MKTPVLQLTLLVISAALVSAGCAAEGEPVAEAESAQTTVGASDGPFRASVLTYADAEGRERSVLSLQYTEPMGSSGFLLCSRFPSQPKLRAVFVTGPEHDRRSVSRPMRVECPRSYGDNPGATNWAWISVHRDEDPELWETLFPPQADGSRWYALQVAALNAYGRWDSRYGDNYRLVLQP